MHDESRWIGKLPVVYFCRTIYWNTKCDANIELDWRERLLPPKPLERNAYFYKNGINGINGSWMPPVGISIEGSRTSTTKEVGIDVEGCCLVSGTPNANKRISCREKSFLHTSPQVGGCRSLCCEAFLRSNDHIPESQRFDNTCLLITGRHLEVNCNDQVLLRCVRD